MTRCEGTRTRCTRCGNWSAITYGRCPLCELIMSQAAKVLARWESDQGEFVELVKYPNGRRIAQCRGWFQQLERFQGLTDDRVIEQMGYEVLRGAYNPSISLPKWNKMA